MIFNQSTEITFPELYSVLTGKLVSGVLFKRIHHHIQPYTEKRVFDKQNKNWFPPHHALLAVSIEIEINQYEFN